MINYPKCTPLPSANEIGLNQRLKIIADFVFEGDQGSEIGT